jgi:hypothetical protein
VLPVPYYFFSFIRFDKFYDTFLSPLHFTITKTLQKPHNTSDSHHSSRYLVEASAMKRRREERTVVTCHVARPHLLRP